jgi:hypothetical protein
MKNLEERIDAILNSNEDWRIQCGQTTLLVRACYLPVNMLRVLLPAHDADNRSTCYKCPETGKWHVYDATKDETVTIND